MNYKKIYGAICERGRDRLLNEHTYYERHHIIPKALGGGDAPSNMTYLTFREHFLVHWMLTKMYDGESEIKMVYAFNMMTKQQPKGKRHSSYLFERAKIKWMNMVHTQEVRDVVASKSKGNTNVRGKTWWFNPTTQQYVRRLEHPGVEWVQQGKPASDKQREAVRKTSTGRRLSQSTKDKISAKAKQRPSNNKGTVWVVNEQGQRKRCSPNNIPVGFVLCRDAPNKPPVHTIESRQKISDQLRGREVSEETRSKISKTLKRGRYGKEEDKING